MTKQPTYEELKERVEELEKTTLDYSRKQEECRRSEELHSLVLTNLSDTVFITDNAGTFTYICPNIHIIFGYSLDEVSILGNVVKLLGDQVVDPGDFETREEIENIEKEVSDKGGREHTLLINVKRVSVDGGTLLYACREITARKRAQEELQKAHDELEEKVKERTNELTQTNDLLQAEIRNHKRAEEQIHSLTQELIKAQETERQMISRELHDSVAQDLSSLKIACQTLLANEPQVSSQVKQKVSEMSEVLHRTVMAVRDLSYSLRPPGLDGIGLVEVISQYCDDFFEKSGIQVDFHSAGVGSTKLDFDMEINLYRLVQEGLTNIIKHADATYAKIGLVGAFPNIILRIEDDGKGFDVEKRLANASHEKRMGLQSMKQRIRLLGGQMLIQSRPGRGTKLSMKIPYREKENGSKNDHINR
jgi:PAS domain S-box-containing protein